MGADYSFYVKIIATHARAFLTLNILAISRVNGIVQICNLKIFGKVRKFIAAQGPKFVIVQSLNRCIQACLVHRVELSCKKVVCITFGPISTPWRIVTLVYRELLLPGDGGGMVQIFFRSVMKTKYHFLFLTGNECAQTTDAR